MPATTRGDIPSGREPRRVLLTPSSSPSVGPPDRPPTKRSRLRSTPSSAISATPSTSNESIASTDVNSARRASTLRVLNTWAQLAERYNKRLDEDDIIDLHRYVIVKDRGAVERASREYHIGHFTLDSDQDYPDADQDQEDSEQEEDDNELNALPPSEATTDDDAPISKKELLRGVPPLSATTDAEDLREFLKEERKRRELAGDEGEDEEISLEQRAALRKELDERLKKREAANQSRDVASAEPVPDREVEATPTRPSTDVPPSNDESEDELALWTHDESTAVYPIARDDSEQDVHEVEQEVIELTESDSDAEFEAILIRPPPFSRVSPLPVPRHKEPHTALQSPPDSGRGKLKSRLRSHSATKPAGMTPKSEDQPRSPLVARKTEAVPICYKKPSISKDTTTIVSDDGLSDIKVASRIPSLLKGKSKEIPAPAEDDRREKTPRSLGTACQGRKRKRIASSSMGGSPPVQSPAEQKAALRSHRKQDFNMTQQLDGPEPTSGEDVSTPEPAARDHSHSSSLFSSAKGHPSTLSIPTYKSFGLDSAQLTSPIHNSDSHLLSNLSTPVTHSHSQRHPSHPPPFFTSPDQGTPGLSLPAHPPPPLNPLQAQQAHYLLAQAMHQLSYLLSVTTPYTAYGSDPGQPWQPPPPPRPHPPYSTPTNYLPQSQDTRHYHTPSSSVFSPGLPSSSPARLSASPSLEERLRSRGRSKSRGRRVSFKLDSGGAIGEREPNAQPDPQYGQINHKPTLEAKRERGKGKATEGSGSSLQLEEDRGSPPREVARGRTPGPPDRKKVDALVRGRSHGRPSR